MEVNRIKIVIWFTMAMLSCQKPKYITLEYRNLHYVVPADLEVVDTAIGLAEYPCRNGSVTLILDSNLDYYHGDSILLYEIIYIDSNKCYNNVPTADMVRELSKLERTLGVIESEIVTQYSKDSTVALQIISGDPVYGENFLSFRIICAPVTIGYLVRSYRVVNKKTYINRCFEQGLIDFKAR